MKWNKYPDVKPKSNGQYLAYNGSSMHMYIFWNGEFYSKGQWMLDPYYSDEQRAVYFSKRSKGKVSWWIAVPEIPFVEHYKQTKTLDYALDDHGIWLTIRPINALTKFHTYPHNKGRKPIKTLEDLLELTVQDLERTPNIGWKTIFEIRMELHKKNYHLKDDESFFAKMTAEKERIDALRSRQEILES